MRKTNIRFYFEVPTHHLTEGSKELSDEHLQDTGRIPSRASYNYRCVVQFVLPFNMV